MKTYLELCQELASEAGITTTGLTSVDGQLGTLGKVVRWVKQALTSIHEEHENWEFLWSSHLTNLQVGVSVYQMADLGLSDLKKFDEVIVDGRTIDVLTWREWKQKIRTKQEFQHQPSDGQVKYICLSPDRKVHVYPAPVTNAPIEIEYFRRSVPLVANGDTPILPDGYDRMIVERALMYYSINEDDMIRYNQSAIEYNNWLGKLEGEYLPAITIL